MGRTRPATVAFNVQHGPFVTRSNHRLDDRSSYVWFVWGPAVSAIVYISVHYVRFVNRLYAMQKGSLVHCIAVLVRVLSDRVFFIGFARSGQKQTRFFLNPHTTNGTGQEGETQ